MPQASSKFKVEPIIDGLMPPRTQDVTKLTGLAVRFAAFVAERYPFELHHAIEAFENAGVSAIKGRDAVKLDAARPARRRALAKTLYEHFAAPAGTRSEERR